MAAPLLAQRVERLAGAFVRVQLCAKAAAAPRRTLKQNTRLEPRPFVSTERAVLGGCNSKHMAFESKGWLGLLLALRPWLRSRLLWPRRCKSTEGRGDCRFSPRSADDGFSPQRFSEGFLGVRESSPVKKAPRGPMLVPPLLEGCCTWPGKSVGRAARCRPRGHQAPLLLPQSVL